MRHQAKLLLWRDCALILCLGVDWARLIISLKELLLWSLLKESSSQGEF